MFFKRLSQVLSDNRENCAWSCGALSRSSEGRRKIHSIIVVILRSRAGVFEFLPSGVRDDWPVVPVKCLLPCLVCRLFRFWNVELGLRHRGLRGRWW